MAPIAETAAKNLKKLRYLSVVSKVCIELESQLGGGGYIDNKTLSLYIADIGMKSNNVNEFKLKLKENPDVIHMPDFFLDQLFSFIHYKDGEEFIETSNLVGHKDEVRRGNEEVGFGKTTQLTQYLAEAGDYTTRGKIVCTQPRRVETLAAAERVAKEFGSTLGEKVGYTVKFYDCTGSDTIIQYMTHGVLLREFLGDENLSQYSVIIVDDAHGRTLVSDTICCLLKQLILRRPGLQCIITSQIREEADILAKYFLANVFRHEPTVPFRVLDEYALEPVSDYLDSSLTKVLQIHLTKPEGDILVFLTDQEDVNRAFKSLHERMRGLRNHTLLELLIVPVYDVPVPSEMQTMVYGRPPTGFRKVILAPSTAEASLAIENVLYIVDSGVQKQFRYDEAEGIDSLIIVRTSVASENVRRKLAGRSRHDGICYRMYPFSEVMLARSLPEITRMNLGFATLVMKVMGIKDVYNIPDPLFPHAIELAMKELADVQALDEQGNATKIGKKMAELLLDHPSSKTFFTNFFADE
ncbi:probable pre-mRNA-splicing factor ATP-dependent RNA helicase DEAH5 [Papaver somniferum]|uniref:probable pre-mRNA-splicing factor ATP-dependent RNA helicase DEAH5 n=1 Tax=Papaver somniferum TaxID=3469 RepID=UPI000E6FBC6A|nr:probable pre-mRNA-splicing factor ATP-dependent RNA helicase DEAH5 [Papaver somniferum]